MYERTKDGIPAVVTAISEQPHQLELCKVRASQTACGAVVSRHAGLNKLNDKVDSTVHRTYVVTTTHNTAATQRGILDSVD